MNFFQFPIFLIFTNWRHQSSSHVNPRKLKHFVHPISLIFIYGRRMKYVRVLCHCPESYAIVPPRDTSHTDANFNAPWKKISADSVPPPPILPRDGTVQAVIQELLSHFTAAADSQLARPRESNLTVRVDHARPRESNLTGMHLACTTDLSVFSVQASRILARTEDIRLIRSIHSLPLCYLLLIDN